MADINTTYPDVSTGSLNKGLIGHWVLDSENGAKDLTPNGNHGTANGGITLGGTTDRKGKTGGATSFDGTDDYILLDGNLQITSVSMWTNLWNVNSAAYLLGNSSTTNGIRYNGSSFLSFSGGSSWEAVNWTKVNRMVHLGIVRVDNTAYYDFYIDGIKIGTSYSGSGSGNIIINTIGMRESLFYFNGLISDVRIYNRALSATEIKLLYDQYKPKEASIGSLQKGLILDMPLTTKHLKSSSVVSDLTPYGNDGTISGATVGSEGTSFDGNDKIDCGVNSIFATGNEDFTMSVWVYPKIIPTTYNYILSIGNTGAGKQAGFGVSTSLRLFLSAYTSPIVTTTYALPELNNWYHLVIKYDGLSDTINFYVNGEFVESRPIPLNVELGKCFIGSHVGGSSYFIGNISQTKIYNRQLSEEEIKLLYEKGRY